MEDDAAAPKTSGDADEGWGGEEDDEGEEESGVETEEDSGFGTPPS